MDLENVRLKDREFKPYLREDQIIERIREMAAAMTRDLKGKEVVFLVVLNGAFLFAADLIRRIRLTSCEVSFLKLSSYKGTKSTGTIRELFGINEVLEGKSVVIVEDIIDTGSTLESILHNLERFHPVEVKTSTLLFKPGAYSRKHDIDYVGFEIPNDFIVGYGLDYDGLGRNLRDIYQVIES